MQIIFVTGGIPFHGHSLRTGAMGGSETAMICVARSLAKLGHDVRVFCECDQPGVYDGVQYFHAGTFSQQNAFNHPDVLIASRWADPLANKVPAGLRVLWNHDVCPTDRTWAARLFQTDLLMCLSDYHVADFREKFAALEPHIWKTSNAVDLELIDQCRKPKVARKLIYTSRPERGLLYLLRDVMPEVVKRYPDVKLYHCCYDLSGAMELPPAVVYAHEQCVDLSQSMSQNVVAMGGLTKEQLYQHLSSAELWVYPTGFPEISCIGAMEAQACGTPIVTTDAFALSETVGPNAGVKLPGLPDDPQYIEEFVERVVQLLDQPVVREEMAEAGRAYVEQQGYTWDAVAASWVEKFHDEMALRRNACGE